MASSPRARRLLVLSVLVTVAAPLGASAQLPGTTAQDRAAQTANVQDREAKEERAPRGEVVATALFQVSRDPVNLLEGRATRLTDSEWNNLTLSQVALLKSHFALEEAVRHPDVAALSLLADRADPVAWLQDQLHIEFPENSELLAIRLAGAERDSDELRQIVNAVAQAYEDKVVYQERQGKLVQRDTIARNLKKLNAEVEDKIAAFRALANEMESASHSSLARTRQAIDLRRLEQVDAELMRLEDELARLEAQSNLANDRTNQVGGIAYRQKRIAALQQERAKLEERISSRADDSTQLTLLKQEIDLLSRVIGELSYELELRDVESQAPPRATLIQSAVIETNEEQEGS